VAHPSHILKNLKAESLAIFNAACNDSVSVIS